MYAVVTILVGLATSYWPGDGLNAGICANGKPFTHADWHVAHRSLPLGTRGTLCNLRTGMCVPTVVADRGPFGCIRRCETMIPEEARRLKARRIKWKKKCHWWKACVGRIDGDWKYRGKFDLTQPVADAIGHRQFDEVAFYYEPRLQTV